MTHVNQSAVQSESKQTLNKQHYTFRQNTVGNTQLNRGTNQGNRAQVRVNRGTLRSRGVF